MPVIIYHFLWTLIAPAVQGADAGWRAERQMLEVWGAGEATVRNWQAKGYSLADLANRADLTAQQVRTPCMPLSALY